MPLRRHGLSLIITRGDTDGLAIRHCYVEYVVCDIGAGGMATMTLAAFVVVESYAGGEMLGRAGGPLSLHATIAERQPVPSFITRRAFAKAIVTFAVATTTRNAWSSVIADVVIAMSASSRSLPAG